VQKEILLVTKGHPFEREPFFRVFDEMDDVGWTHVEQPAAQALFTPEQALGFDAFVMYDMPGIRFKQAGGPEFSEPSQRYMHGFMELLEAGHGFVFLHHAIAGWPAWEEYAEIIGGRFLYVPGSLQGRKCQDSGYHHAVTHTVSVVGDHPVTQGVAPSFAITDEVYLFEVFIDEVEPLLVSDYEFVAENFYSAAKVVLEQKMFNNDGWSHPPGHNLIGWTKTYANSRIVYLQCGDDPLAYANPHYRRLIRNAIHWVSGHQGHR